MNPKISVIVPVYYTEKYLSHCIDSILSQTFSDFEVLLIDDGSTDRSGEICDEYAAKDKRILVIHKPNGGVSSARNLGIENAKGEWVYFVDSDDTLKLDALETMSALTADCIDLVMAGFEVVDEEGVSVFLSKEDMNKKITLVEALKEMYAPTNGWYQGYLWCKLFRASIIKECNLRFNESIFFNEDRLFIVQYLVASKRPVEYTSRPVYTYVMRKTGAMASLEKGFNRKYVTDFDAFVLMKKEIIKLPESNELLWYANQGIRSSYEKNHELMYKFHDCSTRLHWHMVKGMKKSGVLIPYLKDLIRPLIMVVFPEALCRKQ